MARATMDDPQVDDKPVGVSTAIERLDKAPPKYVFDRAQSDQADAARHHVDPRTPPPAANVRVTEAGVEVASTPAPRGPSTQPGIGPPARVGPNEAQDTVDRQMQAAMRAPVDDPVETHERALLHRLRMQAHPEGVSTAPDARARSRRQATMLVAAAMATLLALGLTWALRRGSVPTNDAVGTATQTALPQTAATSPSIPATMVSTMTPTVTSIMVPTVTPTMVPTMTPTMVPTTPATPLTPIRTAPAATTSKPTATASTTTATAPPTTTGATAAPTDTDHPKAHLLGEPQKK